MEEIAAILKRLKVDPKSQFYLHRVNEVNKAHVKLSLRRSRYELDHEIYDVVKVFEKPISEPIGKRTGKNLLPRVTLSTRLDDTQFSVSDNGQRFHADLVHIRYLHPQAHKARYVLVIVDVYSQRVYLYGLYRKDQTVDAFVQFLNACLTHRGKRCSHQVYVQTDEGMEFFNKELLKLFRGNDT